MKITFPLSAYFSFRRLFAGGLRGVSSARLFSKGRVAALVGGLFLVLLLLLPRFGVEVSGSLLQRNPATVNPVSGIFISRAYQAKPSERGSVLLEAGEILQQFEGAVLTIATDPAYATIIAVRKTAVTQNFELSVSYPSIGVARVALVGVPRQIAPGTGILDIELQCADSSVNAFGREIDIRLLGVSYMTDGDHLQTRSHDGLVTIKDNLDAAPQPIPPRIIDVEPGLLVLVRGGMLTITGQALPGDPHVFLGSTVLSVLFSSPSRIVAQVPSSMQPGVYTVSVESLLAEERVVVIQNGSALSRVDILEDLLFFNPNPVQYNTQQRGSSVLWIPVFNPLGSQDPLFGTVDLSALGGDPNVTFEGTGTPVLGDGGTMINWFRIPQSGVLSLSPDLETNADYPVTVRIENRGGSIDDVTEMLSLRAAIPQGGMPVFGQMETVPSVVAPGDDVTVYIDISDTEGIETVSLATMRLTSLGLGMQNLTPVLRSPSGGPPLTTAPFTTTFRIPDDAAAGVTYAVDLFARDKDGNETAGVFDLTISASGGQQLGDPPVFIGRKEARPSMVNAGEKTAFFIEIMDPNGTNSIDLVTVDLIGIGGGIFTLSPTLTNTTIGTLPVVYTGEFTVPVAVPGGAYGIPVRAIDRNGLSAETTVPVTVTSQGAAVSVPPAFGARKIASPNPAGPGSEVTFFVDVKDDNGTSTISTVSIDLIGIGGSIVNLNRIVNPIGNSTAPVTYSTKTSLPSTLSIGEYGLPLRAVDTGGLETAGLLQLSVSSESVGAAPRFEGRLEARPQDIAPGGTVTFFAELTDPDGTDTISFVTADLIDIGGSIVELKTTVKTVVGSTNTVVYAAEYEIPSSVAIGTYSFPIRAVDTDGHQTTAFIPLTVSSGAQGSGPRFSGRLETDPHPVRVGGDVTFYASVSDPDGTETVEQVTIDLIDVGGGVQEMKTDVGPVGGTTVPVVYTAKHRLPGNVAPGIYRLPVRAIDADGHATMTGLTMSVSALSGAGILPVVRQFFATPPTAPPNDETSVIFTVEVEDNDGIDDVKIVRMNLQVFGRGYIYFKRDNNSVIQNGKRGIFYSDAIRIPKTVVAAVYPLTVEVEDGDANRVTRQLSFTVGSGSRGGDPPSILESRFIPEIASPGAKAKLYVEIEDRNGTDNITVIGDFTEIRQEAKELDQLIDFPSGTLATRNTFVSPDITVPEDLLPGVYDIPLTIVDDTNNIVRRSVRLRVQRGGADEGQVPRIDVTSIFQSPRVFANNDKGGNELHVLVNDPDDDVLTVIANLRGLASAKSASVRGDAKDFDLMCGASKALACMKPGVLETTTSRWFILEDIRIPGTTLASEEPYMIELTAIDASGHTEKVTIPFTVGGADVAQMLTLPPEFRLLVPVDDDELELVVAPPVDFKTLDRTGKQFRIQDTLQALSSLNVKRVAWDSSATILYLQTDVMKKNYQYIFHVLPLSEQGDSPLADVYGNPFVKDSGGSINFISVGTGNRKPEIERVRILEPGVLDVEFTTPVLPSSVHPDILANNVTLRSLSRNVIQNALRGVLHSDGKILRLEVDPLLEGDRYELRMMGVVASGKASSPPEGISYIFTARMSQEVSCGRVILPTPDLNEDNRVNFDDFTLFSSVYNTEYDESSLAPILGCEEVESSVSFITTPRAATSTSTSSPRSSFGGELPHYSP